MFQDNGRTDWMPADIAGRNVTHRCPDVRSDGVIQVMPVQVGTKIAGCVPELCETWIKIDVNATTHPLFHCVYAEMPSDIDQQVCTVSQVKQLVVAQSE